MRPLIKVNVLIYIILLIALIVRVAYIESNSLYGDELTITLDAYSLLKTSHDQLGNFLPLTFPMGAGRPPGYVYGSIPFTALFGPSALGVRALSILSGLGIILLNYFIGKKILSKKLGLIVAGITAVSFWDISLSRGGFEAHFALFLALLGMYLFLSARQKPILYLVSALSFGLTLHTYPTYKVSLLLFLPLLFWYQGNFGGVLKTGKKYFLTGVFILIGLGVLSLSQTFLGGSEVRFSNINIFSQSQLKDSIEQKVNLERSLTKLPPFFSKYFHNKIIEYTKVLSENYLQNFSIDFLILHGDRNPRHNMATMGEISLAELILVFTGIVYSWFKQKKTIVFLMLWILLAPIPTAIVDMPHALRSSFMLPPLIILSALGLVIVLSYKNKLSLFLLTSLFLIQFVFFAQKLYSLSPGEYSNFWSYPAKLASEIALRNQGQYDYIIISDKINDIEFAYPVYAQIEPGQIIAQNKTKATLNGYKLKKYGNVYIGAIQNNDLENFFNNLSGKILYMGDIADIDYLQDYERITGLNNLNALIITKRKI